MTAYLLMAGGAIYALLGFLHGLYTWLDLSRPRRIVPDDPAVIESMKASGVRLAGQGTTMWKAWVGFNFSHSLGATLFGAGCIALGGSLPMPALSGPILLLPVLISALYALLAARYWFRIPIFGTCAATACFLVAWIVY